MADVIAVDLGGTNIRAARVNADGKILAREKVPTLAKEGGMSAVVQRISELVAKLRSPDTKGIGVGTPGIPDPVTGVMRIPAVNIPGSDNYPLGGEISKLSGLPVWADNDASLALLGEVWLGAGQGEEVAVIFTLGTGIGGGLVVDGDVYHGHHNLGTEFGHMTIDFKGRKCKCGGIGCVEQYASATALIRDAREALQTSPLAASSSMMKTIGGVAHLEKVDARLVCDAAKNGDALALQLVDQYCDWLACGIGGVVNALNPSCIIIGGGVSLAGELLTSRIEKALDNGRSFKQIWRDAKLKIATLGDDAGLLGAARMALKKTGALK